MNGQPKFRWQATLSEATARSTAPLIGAVLTMQVDPLESGERTVVLSNWRERMAEGEPTLKVVLRWHRSQQRRCQVEVHSSAEGPFADPWSLQLAQRLKQILA